jgi:transposase InsO family protein
MAFTRMLPNQKTETTIGFLNEVLAFFALHIDVRALLTDNGSSYRSSQFRQACQKLAFKHHHTRPYTPRTNGKAERFIHTRYVSGPMPNTGPTRKTETFTGSLGLTTISIKDLMVASTTNRPSADPRL